MFIYGSALTMIHTIPTSVAHMIATIATLAQVSGFVSFSVIALPLM